jgi:hypothetical protein
MSTVSSVPAFDLHDSRAFAMRWVNIANHQLISSGLLVMALGSFGGWMYTAHALKENSKVIAHFKPIVVRENELGQTALLVHQDLNFSPDARSIQSALSFWAQFHFDHVRATMADYRTRSFTWMTQPYADAIEAQDKNSRYISSFVSDMSKQQYRIEVKHVVLTNIVNKPDQLESGAADIYAYREYLDDAGLPKPKQDADAFIVHVTWGRAVNIPENEVADNPLGIAVEYYNETRSML